MRSGAGLFIGLALLAAGGPLGAQTNDNEFEPLNFAFAAYAGSGIYTSSGQTVWLFRIPATIPVLPSEDRAFGLRVRVRGTLGFFDFDPEDLLELTLPDSVGTFSLLAGVDFPIRAGERFTIGPFVDLGPARDTATDTWAGVFGFGAWSRAEFPWKSPRRFVLWNELVRAGNFGGEALEREGFGKFVSELELRLPLDWSPAGRPIAVGPFVEAVWLWDALEIGGILDEETKIRVRYEAGVKIGPEEKERIGKIPVPRLGLSYRFGEGLTSVRFIISTRY